MRDSQIYIYRLGVEITSYLRVVKLKRISHCVGSNHLNSDDMVETKKHDFYEDNGPVKE